MRSVHLLGDLAACELRGDSHRGAQKTNIELAKTILWFILAASLAQALVAVGLLRCFSQLQLFLSLLSIMAIFVHLFWGGGGGVMLNAG